MSLNWELILSAIAVSISAYSFFSSRKMNIEINKQQLQINKLLLAKEQEYLEEKNKAKFRAFIQDHRNHYQLTIVNQGKATAKNLQLEIIIDEKYKGHFYNINDVFPISLNAGQTAKVSYSRGMDFPSKFIASLSWDDEYGKANKEEIELTT